MKPLSLPPAWAAAITEWTGALGAAGRSKQTIETRVEHLRRLSRTCGVPSPGLLTERRLTAWAGRQDWAAETRRSVYASIRGFFRWAHGVGLVQEDVSTCLPATKPGRPCPRPIPERAYRAALLASIGDRRAHVALRLAGEAGLRRAEIALVSRADLFQDLEGWSLVVHGKGAKTRLVPLTESLAMEVCGMLGPVWLLPNEATGTAMTPRHVAKIAGKYLPPGSGLHSLRHRFADQVNRQTRDLRSLQVLLGHESLATTQRYVPTDTAALRHAVAAAS